MKCNTGDVVEFEFGEDFVGGFEAEDLARPVIESVLDARELMRGDEVEVGALWQVFADQAIGVFVGAALPGAVWIAEEDVHAKALGQGVVQSHLAALVVGECFAQAGWYGAKASGEALEDAVGACIVELDEHKEAAGSLDDGADGRGVPGALDEVAFPVAGDDASGDLRRPQIDRSHAL